MGGRGQQPERADGERAGECTGDDPPEGSCRHQDVLSMGNGDNDGTAARRMVCATGRDGLVSTLAGVTRRRPSGSLPCEGTVCVDHAEGSVSGSATTCVVPEPDAMVTLNLSTVR